MGALENFHFFGEHWTKPQNLCSNPIPEETRIWHPLVFFGILFGTGTLWYPCCLIHFYLAVHSRL
jgi:hypothetical protein